MEYDGYETAGDDEEFYVPAQLLENAEITTEIADLEDFEPLDFIDESELYMELVDYFDFRRTVVKRYKSCKEDISCYESYEGGRESVGSGVFELDDHDIRVEVALSKLSDEAPFVLKIRIFVDE